MSVLKQNIELFDKIQKLAKSKNLIVRHNITSVNSRDGYHRYVILNPTISNSKNISINSKNCLDYSEARFSKYYKPSIIGEKKALNYIMETLKTL